MCHGLLSAQSGICNLLRRVWQLVTHTVADAQQLYVIDSVMVVTMQDFVTVSQAVGILSIMQRAVR